MWHNILPWHKFTFCTHLWREQLELLVAGKGGWVFQSADNNSQATAFSYGGGADGFPVAWSWKKKTDFDLEELWYLMDFMFLFFVVTIWNFSSGFCQYLCHGHKSITRWRLVSNNLDGSLPQRNGSHVVGVVGAERQVIAIYNVKFRSPAPLLPNPCVDKNMKIPPDKRFSAFHEWD